MQDLKEVCLRAINLNQKNPKIELKYIRTYDNVFLTYIGTVAGYLVRQEDIIDVYEFNARELYNYLVGRSDRSVTE